MTAAEGEEGKPKKKKYKKRKKEEPPPPPPMLLVKGEDGQEYVRMEVEGETILEPMGKKRSLALWSKIEKKHRQNSHPIIHCPTSEGVSEVSERANE